MELDLILPEAYLNQFLRVEEAQVRIRSKSVHSNFFRPILQHRLHLSRELIRQRAVNQAMAESERQKPHRSDRNHVVNHNRHFLNHADTKDRYLWLVDHRRRKYTPEAAEIRDGERATLHLVGLELSGAGPRRKVHDGPLQAGDGLLIGVV